MIYIKSFKNYEEFKQLFAMVKHGNGVVSRKNKILLAWLKDRSFLHWWLMYRNSLSARGIHEEYLDAISYLHARDMNATLRAAKHILYGATERMSVVKPYKVCFPGIDWVMCHYNLELDSFRGICEDGDTKSVRYINIDRDNRVFKMKAGKFITSCMESNAVTKRLPEQVKRWLGEEFARDWQAYAETKVNTASNLTLHVGDDWSDFRNIYDDELYTADFHSCMAGQDQYSFYTNSVDASAAWLENADGDIVARCVIFDEVRDENGEIWRLAERQYAENEDDVLKQILVNKLIEEGYIDGYKRVGVDCHDNRNFVANDGSSLRDKRFWVRCSLEDGETLSYQDSFIYYDYNASKAYNTDHYGYTDKLDVTDECFERDHSGEKYSAYDDTYYNESVAVYDGYHDDWMHEDDAEDAIFHGDHIKVHRDRADYFVWSEHEDCLIYENDAQELADGTYCLEEDAVKDINGDWQLEGDCKYSDYLQEYILEDDAVWSDFERGWLSAPDAYKSKLLNDWFSDEDDLEEAEREYAKEHTLMCIPA